MPPSRMTTSPGSCLPITIWRRSRPPIAAFGTRRSNPSPRRLIPRDMLKAQDRCSCSRTRVRKACSRRASGSLDSSSTLPNSRFPPTAWNIPAVRGFSRRSRGWKPRSGRLPRAWVSISRVLARLPPRRRIRRPFRGSVSGCRGRIRTPSAGRATRWINATSPIPTCTTRTSAKGICKGNLNRKFDVMFYGHVDLELAEQIEGIPKAWGPMPFKKTAATPSFGTPAESDDITGGIGYEGLAQLQRFVDDGGLLVTLGNGTMLALEGGIVRGVRRESGGVPRSSTGGGAAAAAAAQVSETRTPGSHLRVSFDRPDSPILYGYPAHTHVFRQNYAIYATPRRWLRMAYCTTCLDGPFDPRGVIMTWGDSDGQPLVISGQVWGADGLIRHPTILDMHVGKGH